MTFFRPLGGGIDCGEISARAVEREVREEIGADVTRSRLLGTIENVFTHLGEPGHEIVQVYDGEFVDPSIYDRSSIPGRESDGQPFVAVWHDHDAFSAEMPLYPKGLLALLKSRAGLLAENV